MNLTEMLKELNAKYYSTKEAAETLSKATGAKVNTSHVRRLVKSEKVENVDVLGKLYVDRDSLNKLIASGWAPGQGGVGDREYRKMTVYLLNEKLAEETAAIKKALGRDVKITVANKPRGKKKAESK